MTYFEAFIECAKNRKLELNGFHVHKDGKTIYEWYLKEDKRRNLYSGSKTFIAIAIGIALDEGLVKLEDCLLDNFPSYMTISKPGSENITVRDLVLMSSGHQAFTGHNRDVDDLLGVFFTREVSNAPGQSFIYEDLSTYILARLLEVRCETDLYSYLSTKIFEPLGLERVTWECCKDGFILGYTGLYLTTEEYSRLGVLLLNKGVYSDTRVVSSSFVDQMKLEHIDTSNKVDEESKQGYGFHILKNSIRNSYRADGMYGQICSVFEDYNAVVTYTGHNETSGKDALRLVYDMILPHIK